jgi:predicted O-methyltransferase YrrM
LTIKRDLPTIALDELKLDSEHIKLTEDEELDGNIIGSELEIITKIVSKLKPKRIFEIGTFDGRTTINLAQNTPKETQVFTLDLPVDQVNLTKLKLYSKPEIDRDDTRYINKQEIGLRYKKYSEKKKITQLLGDSATFNFNAYCKSMDFIFVDGSHSKDYVKNDTEVALRLANNNSVVMWHDYTNWEDVTNVMNEYFKSDTRFKNLKHIKGTTFLYLNIQRT